MQKIRCYIVIWLMLVPMLVLADVGTLYDKADSLYNAQQYDEAQKLALEALAQCKDSADVADCASLLGSYVKGIVHRSCFYSSYSACTFYIITFPPRWPAVPMPVLRRRPPRS